MDKNNIISRIFDWNNERNMWKMKGNYFRRLSFTLEEEVDIEWLNDLYIKTHYSNGNEIDKPYIKHRLDDFVGIDHQSAPGEDGECKKLAESFADPVKVWNFVMDDGNEIWTGNDNDDPPYNW